MEYVAADLRFWFFVFVAGIWMMRARRALQTLDRAPFVRFRTQDSPSASCRVSVIVPAKNEEANIGHCLETLLIQDHPDYEIIVVNDNSTDRTADILVSYEGRDRRVRVVHAPPTPGGWTGKNHAIEIGSHYATGDWFLFTDADTIHEPGSLSSSLAHAAERDLALLTLTPRCLSKGFVENVVQPCAMAMMGLWFPIEKVNASGSPVIFGNGQYLLIERNLYEQLGGHRQVRGEFLEDFALVKLAKAMRARFQCAVGTEVFGTRMYHSLTGIWNGWRRIFLHAFNRNKRILVSKFAGLLFFSVLPFTVFFRLLLETPPPSFILGLAGVILIFILGTAWKTYGILKAKKIYALFFPLGALLLAMIVMDAVWVAAAGKKTVWR